jgi:alpha-tubulin suppressor-like RCC1 family protein
MGYRLAPVAARGLSSGVVAIAGGEKHSCALTSAGAVKCWGWNFDGQIGDGTWNNYRLTPTAVSGLSSGVVAITAGERHSCALTSAGAVKCWGSNSGGQIGDGTQSNIRLTPVAVSGLSSGVVAITAGGSNTCALTSAGAVKCWGFNSDGELGDGTTTSHFTPVPVSGLSSGIVAIATGRYHSCAVTGAGALKCWGANFGGQLGDGTNTRRLIPTTIRGMTTLVRSRAFLSTGALGAGAHTLRAGFRGDVRHSSSIGAIIQTVE